MAFLDKAGLERLWAHIVSLVGTKVEKVEGKGLSTNDFTTEEKEKLASINLDEIQSSIDSTKTYADSAAAAVKNDLLNGAGEAYDTLKELGELIDDNTDALAALETVAAGKADAVHTHTTEEITDFSERINAALMSSQADFAVTDESNPSFIKNKPTEEDAMELLAEMDVIQPMADENGALYVDENNTIYVI